MHKIEVLNDFIEATFMEEILREEGLPYAIRSYEDGAYGNLFQKGWGWGAIWGQEEDAPRIKALLAELRQSVPQTGEDISKPD